MNPLAFLGKVATAAVLTVVGVEIAIATITFLITTGLASFVLAGGLMAIMNTIPKNA